MSDSAPSTDEAEPALAAENFWSRFRLPIAAVSLFAFAAGQRPVTKYTADAFTYLDSSTALAAGDPVFERGLLAIRGVLTLFVYAPAAFAEQWLTGAGPAIILIQNALLIAVLGAIILPKIAARLGYSSLSVTWISAALTWLVLARFAPLPLMDIPAATLFFLGIWLALERKWWTYLLAGLSIGLTFNLRPAYLLPAAFVLVAIAVMRPRLTPMAALGFALALVPQSIYNLARGFSWLPMPPESVGLANSHAGFASYIVRYDTVLIDGSPNQQFYCDPKMAGLLGSSVDSSAELLRGFAGDVPWSIVLLLQRFAASLAWTPDTPYSNLPSVESHGWFMPIATIVIFGTAALIFLARGKNTGALVILAMLTGALASTVTAAMETRFAIPIILTGIIGISVAKPVYIKMAASKRGRIWLGILIGLTVLTYFLAMQGLDHPLPNGSPAAVGGELCSRT